MEVLLSNQLPNGNGTEARSIADFPDIIYHVVSHLDPERPRLSNDASKSSRQSLARLARTHKNFTEPALKTLWRHLPDDKPLADLLCALGISERHCLSDSDSEPEIIFDPKVPPPVDYSYTLCGPDDPSTHPHWRRFEEYAAYVRAISGLFAFDGPRRLELWEDLGRRIAPAPLLPHLQAVSFRQDRTRRKFSGAFFLLFDSVTSLEYGGRDYYNPAIRSAILRAFCYAEEIRNLRIPMQPWEDMHTFGDHICDVEVVPEVESRTLKYLAKIQHLRSLSLTLKAIDMADSGMLTYPRLETLDLKGHWTDHTALFHIVNAPNLRTLSLEVLQRGASSQMFAKYTSECLTAVSTRFPSLASLAVRMNSSPPTALVYNIGAFYRIVQSTFQTSLLDVVRPLLPLHALHAFTLVLPNYIDMTCSSDDLLALSEAWRDLEELHIQLWDYFTLKGLPNHPGAGERPRGGPFAALAHFARNCPRLRTLHLPPMDATQLEVPGEVLPSVDDIHGLQNLVVSKFKISPGLEGDPDSRIQLTGRVAEFVRGVFPGAAWPFRKDGLTLIDGWLVVPEKACCFDCDDPQLVSARKS